MRGFANKTCNCPRNFTRERLINGLQAGRLFYVDSFDTVELAELMQMEHQGLVKMRRVELEVQSRSGTQIALEFWWNNEQQEEAEEDEEGRC